MAISTKRGTEAALSRRETLGLLARAEPGWLARAVEALPDRPGWRFLRVPETGLVMVRGRAGGDGAPFNLGEATVTRCVVATETGGVGYGQAIGRSGERARLIALLDAMLQDARFAASVRERVLAPLAAKLAAEDGRAAEETAATVVDFFTLARGEDE